jgi:hypothetical protein
LNGVVSRGNRKLIGHGIDEIAHLSSTLFESFIGIDRARNVHTEEILEEIVR